MEQQEEKQEEVKVAKVCDGCGSDDVYFDASAYWNREKQEFEFELTHEREYCSVCHSETRTLDVPWTRERWANVVVKGDLVNFHPDRSDYANFYTLTTPGSQFNWDLLDTALGLVVDERPEGRDTVLVRLFTGEDIEVWPRDLIVVGQMESGWELFGEKDDEQKAA